MNVLHTSAVLFNQGLVYDFTLYRILLYRIILIMFYFFISSLIKCVGYFCHCRINVIFRIGIIGMIMIITVTALVRKLASQPEYPPLVIECLHYFNFLEHF